MSRAQRPHMPGTAFHITARTQGKQPWFEESLRARVEDHLREGVHSSDARLLAHIVMLNHFHLVLRQGTQPLGWIMQPIMRRIALLIQRRYSMKGHVFERRFHSKVCENADHLRRSIVYTNINAERAHICAADEYRWSSAVLYRNGLTSAEPCDVAVAFALKLFGDRPDLSEMQLRACYHRYVAWRREKDRQKELGKPMLELEPPAPAGDAFFLEHFCASPPTNGRPIADLRDRARELLRYVSKETSIELLRRPRLNRGLTDIRRQLICALLEQRYRVVDIARFLHISDSAVSRIAIQMRYGVLQSSGMSKVVRQVRV